VRFPEWCGTAAPSLGKPNLISESEEGFLHSGTAYTAVPPVGMTDFGWLLRWENFGEVGFSRENSLIQNKMRLHVIYQLKELPQK